MSQNVVRASRLLIVVLWPRQTYTSAHIGLSYISVLKNRYYVQSFEQWLQVDVLTTDIVRMFCWDTCNCILNAPLTSKIRCLGTFETKKERVSNLGIIECHYQDTPDMIETKFKSVLLVTHVELGTQHYSNCSRVRHSCCFKLFRHADREGPGRSVILQGGATIWPCYILDY